MPNTHTAVALDPIFASAIARADKAELEQRLERAREWRRQVAAGQGNGCAGPESMDHATARLHIRVILSALERYAAPVDARDAIGCYCPSDCACHNQWRQTVCGCTGTH